MSGIVIDASVALAWCFPDESSGYADSVLEGLRDREAIVPAIWPIEIANALIVGERRKRIRQPEISRFIELLKGLNLHQDIRLPAEVLSAIVPLARSSELTAYDAAYLDVAIRHELPLASIDSSLRRACRAAGVQLYDV